MFVVYRHINKINQKSYIGITSGCGTSYDVMMKRWQGHCKFARKGVNLTFSRAIRKYGEEEFEHVILEECVDAQQLKDREVFWIKHFDTFKNGYNMTVGGDNHIGESNPRSKLTEKDVIDIKNFWNAKTLDAKETGDFYRSKADEFNVTTGLICRIIKGNLWQTVGPELINTHSKRGQNHEVGKKISLLWKNPQYCEIESKKRRGANNAMAKLSSDQVLQIRKEFESIDVSKFGERSKFYRKTAERFNITPELACGIIKRRCWKHI